jgi:hypothetical protein
MMLFLGLAKLRDEDVYAPLIFSITSASRDIIPSPLKIHDAIDYNDDDGDNRAHKWGAIKGCVHI